MVFWVSASIDVAREQVGPATEFWSAVAGGALPGHLAVRPTSGDPEVLVHPQLGEPPPEVPAPASFPGVRRSRVYQVCLDIPRPRFEEQAAAWAALSGGRVEVLGRRPEFAWLRIPGGPRPLDLLLQRLDRAEGAVTAHLDVGTTDRPAEVRRHVDLGATVRTDEEFWTVLADPAGLPYCVTDRDPATGELT